MKAVPNQEFENIYRYRALVALDARRVSARRGRFASVGAHLCFGKHVLSVRRKLCRALRCRQRLQFVLFGAAEIFKNKQSENKQDYYSFPKIKVASQRKNP